tara:strand:+ start:21663 stop:21890 length:228 start_codon:yes stop_codon:yes gene_type:complete
MLFGLPWFAIIAIVAIGGAMIFSYKEKELALEEKSLFNVREADELRGNIERLQRRIEYLENKVTKRSSNEPQDDD